MMCLTERRRLSDLCAGSSPGRPLGVDGKRLSSGRLSAIAPAFVPRSESGSLQGDPGGAAGAGTAALPASQLPSWFGADGPGAAVAARLEALDLHPSPSDASAYLSPTSSVGEAPGSTLRSVQFRSPSVGVSGAKAERKLPHGRVNWHAQR